MDDPLSPSESDSASWAELAQRLEHMRDALVELSLFLEDCRYELSSSRKAEANRRVEELLNQLRMSND